MTHFNRRLHPATATPTSTPTALAIALLLAACGGGGSAPNTPANDASGSSGGSASSGSGGTSTSSGGSSGGSSSGGAASDSPAGSSSGGSGASSGGSSSGGGSSAAALATALRGKSHFLIGMGNDLASDHNQDGAYTLGTTLDLHYAYLSGLMGMGGWPDWNAGGTFVNILTDSADAHGVTPMFTLYGMAAQGEGNTAVLTTDSYMKAYWDGAKLLFQRLAVFGKPAVVQFEPDWWGFIMQKSADGKMAVHVTSLAPDCASSSNDVIGMAGCMRTLARKYAPKTKIGFHVSAWGGTATAIISFFKAIGADQADFLTTDMLDRDAGCFEAHTDPNCQRSSTGLYWDESNTTSPNFHDHFAWVKQITQGIGLPMMWWQVPFGVPSTTPGGTAGHYRDNRVHYMFGHVGEMIAAGGVGAVFGTGAGNQTYINTDGNQFKNAVTGYFASPTALP
jgi:hypothetical protein